MFKNVFFQFRLYFYWYRNSDNKVSLFVLVLINSMFVCRHVCYPCGAWLRHWGRLHEGCKEGGRQQETWVQARLQADINIASQTAGSGSPSLGVEAGGRTSCNYTGCMQWYIDWCFFVITRMKSNTDKFPTKI